MNWIFGKNQNHQMLPPSTPLQQQRMKQIKSLHTNNSNVVEESRDFEYRVLFSCGKTLCTLQVSLPPQFPSDKPIVHVSPPMKHPWVDENMTVLGCTEINLFNMHTDLGKAIQNIVKEFKKNKPQFMPTPYHGPSTSSTVAVGNLISTSDDVTDSTFSSNIYSSPDEILAAGRPSTISEIHIIMRKLEELDINKLEEICINPDLLLDYVHEMDSLVDLQNQRKRLVEQNEALAMDNLTNEPIIEDLKVELKSTFERYNELYNSFEEKMIEQDELRKNYDTSNILTNLRIAILQAEEESEVIAENFLKGSVKLDEFMETFLEKRKTCHLRRLKEDKLKNIVDF